MNLNSNEEYLQRKNHSKDPTLKKVHYRRNNYNSLLTKPLKLDFLFSLSKLLTYLPTTVTSKIWNSSIRVIFLYSWHIQ